MDTKAIIRSLPLVAAVLGDRYGVRVQISGSTAYTDGKTINIPALPGDADEKTILLARGFLDHEAAHIRSSDMDMVAAARPDRLEKFLWNCLEDYRVEHELVGQFPGCRANFDWLIRHVFLEDGKKEAGSDDPASLVLDWIIRKIRSWDVPELDGLCTDMAMMAGQSFPGLIPQIEGVLEEFRERPRSCQDSLDYARRIKAILVQKDEVSPTGPDKTPDTDSGDESGTDEQDDAPDADGSSRIETEALQDVPGDLAPPQDDPLHGQATPSFHADMDLPEEMDAQIAKILQAAYVPEQEMAVARAVPRRSSPLPPEDLIRSRRLTVALKTRLRGLLQARSYQGRQTARHGRLDAKRLHALAVNDSRVFLRTCEKQAPETVVHILLDASSSMSRTIDEAALCCHALADALLVSGFTVAVTAFPTGQTDSGMDVIELLNYGERIHADFSVPVYGTTPMAEALWHVLQGLLQRREPRKIVMIVTDGEPDSEKNMHVAVRAAYAMGVEIYGIGLDAPYIGDVFEESVNISSIDGLADALFSSLSDRLLRCA